MMNIIVGFRMRRVAGVQDLSNTYVIKCTVGPVILDGGRNKVRLKLGHAEADVSI